jgi:hypothetical protein
MTDERSRVYLGHLDLGSGFALRASEMIFFERVRFSGVGVSDNDQGLASGGTVKQHLTPPDSVARTNILRYIILYNLS